MEKLYFACTCYYVLKVLHSLVRLFTSKENEDIWAHESCGLLAGLAGKTSLDGTRGVRFESLSHGWGVGFASSYCMPFFFKGKKKTLVNHMNLAFILTSTALF